MPEPQFPQTGLNAVIQTCLDLVAVTGYGASWADFGQGFANVAASGIAGDTPLKAVLTTPGKFVEAVGALAAYRGDQVENAAEDAAEAAGVEFYASHITAFSV